MLRRVLNAVESKDSKFAARGSKEKLSACSSLLIRSLFPLTSVTGESKYSKKSARNTETFWFTKSVLIVPVNQIMLRQFL